MKKIILICLTLIALTACSSDGVTKKESRVGQNSDSVEGYTVAEMTKSGPNLTTRQAKDAWFVHRAVAATSKELGMYCLVESEFENKSDVALYQVQASYRLHLTKKALEGGAIDDMHYSASVASPWRESNPDPLRSGETRVVTSKLSYTCEMYDAIKLHAFIARGVNSGGTKRHLTSIKDGAPALIIDNQTSLNFAR